DPPGLCRRAASQIVGIWEIDSTTYWTHQIVNGDGADGVHRRRLRVDGDSAQSIDGSESLRACLRNGCRAVFAKVPQRAATHVDHAGVQKAIDVEIISAVVGPDFTIDGQNRRCAL